MAKALLNARAIKTKVTLPTPPRHGRVDFALYRTIEGTPAPIFALYAAPILARYFGIFGLMCSR